MATPGRARQRTHVVTRQRTAFGEVISTQQRRLSISPQSHGTLDRLWVAPPQPAKPTPPACTTPRSKGLRSRFAALSDRTFPAGKPAATLGDLTAEHLEYLRPKFFEGGRFRAAEGGAPPVPLKLGRREFAEAVRPVLQFESGASLLQLFAQIEALGAGGVTWDSLLAFVRRSIEGYGLGAKEGGVPRCKYAEGAQGEQPTLHAWGATSRRARDRAAAGEVCFLTLVGARGLGVADAATGASDPTCIVYWNGERAYQSATQFATTDPEWQETLMLRLPAAEETGRAGRPPPPPPHNELRVEVYDRDAGGTGDFLGRVVLVGAGLGGLRLGSGVLAFRLLPDPGREDNRHVQGVLALSASKTDPATLHSAQSFVDLKEAIEASHAASGSALEPEGGAAEQPRERSAVGRAEQLRAAGYTWDVIVGVLEQERAEQERRGLSCAAHLRPVLSHRLG